MTPTPDREPTETFDSAWLALREPADRRARNGALRRRVADALAGRDALRVTDMGCGSGSNLRALAPHLDAARQSWTLLDHDPRLLDAARAALAAWADGARDVEGGLELRVDGRELRVAFRRLDLARNVEAAVAERPDLLTAAALFDLASAEWMERLAACCARERVPLYAALTHAGRDAWTPPHKLDDAVLGAFAAHQFTDKGFGPAEGARAAETLARAFAARGVSVDEAPSPWRLGADDAALVAELAAGVGRAAADTGLVTPEDAAAWVSARAGAAVTVPHLDQFFDPPGRAGGAAR